MEKTISEMHRVLKTNGLLIADFPSDADGNCGRGIRVAENTYLHPFLNHSDVPHYYFSQQGLEQMLESKFKVLKLESIDYPDPKHFSTIKAFLVEAQKR